MRYIDPRHKVLNHLNHIIALKQGEYAPPINVEIDLSNRCNLGCKWCHFAHTHTRGPLATSEKPDGLLPTGDLMNADMAISIINQLHDAGVKSVTWTGGGEPTLHPDFLKIITHAAKLGLRQGLYTNGVHITPDTARVLKQQMAWVYVSLDECEPDTYKASKQSTKFSYAIGAIRHLVNAKGSATIGVGFMLHDINYGSITAMKRLAIDELHADYVQFRPTIRYEYAAPFEFVDDRQWLDNAMVLLDDYQDDPQVYADLERFSMYRDWARHDYDTCYFSALQTVITPNGKVWQCVNKRGYSGAELGDLSESKFKDIVSHIKPCAVNGDCRIMCRGHMANLTLDKMIQPSIHEDFI